MPMCQWGRGILAQKTETSIKYKEIYFMEV
nr:MAG TPA: hypothetical protein [Caudoviricetes sp.]